MPETLNLVDAFLLLVVALGAFAGFRRGFAAGALGLAVLALTLFIALWGYRYPAVLFERHVMPMGVWALPLAFLFTFVLARLVLGAVAGGLLAAVPSRVHAHPVNRALGVLPGLVIGLLHAAILALVLLAAPVLDGLTVLARDSALASRLSAPAEWLESKFSPVFEEAVSKTLSRLTVKPQSRESVPLPFTVAAPRPRPDLESRMLELVNAERAQAGLQPLKPDADSTQVARAHAADMFARGYFSHVTPDGQDPFDRMRRAQVRYLTAGENLALAPTLPMAHQGLMNSPGHRANILRPAFGRVGIGIQDGGRHGLMVTQVFRN